MSSVDPTNVFRMLSWLTEVTTELVPLDYGTYRRNFSVVRVPIIESLGSDEGPPIIVKVKKQEAIDFLKSQHGFLTKSDLSRELQEAADAHTTDSD